MRVLSTNFFKGLVIASTIVAFLCYIYVHPDALLRLVQTSIFTVAAIIAMYTGSLACLSFILHVLLQFCGHRLSNAEYFLLTGYSAITNFFGPGQSGPGVRAVYLKVKHGIPIRYTLFGTLIYLGWLFFLSGMMLFTLSVPWWIICVCAGVIAVVLILLIRYFVYAKGIWISSHTLQSRLAPMMFMTGIGTAMQIAFITTVYFIELRTVDSSVSFSQVICFTGAANFSLFVAITPGAIGIREALVFLLHKFHGVSTEAIALASALDRAAYLVVLALLGMVMLFTRADRRFHQVTEASSLDDS